ncbi:MAG: hypothetical protein KatS3mg077_2818 [Candidatus Binatia bacterium]|nr:MAG: hypothetical protein KatS3mg077_2818 [Candidatus Binatia bacterium]
MLESFFASSLPFAPGSATPRAAPLGTPCWVVGDAKDKRLFLGREMKRCALSSTQLWVTIPDEVFGRREMRARRSKQGAWWWLAVLPCSSMANVANAVIANCASLTRGAQAGNVLGSSGVTFTSGDVRDAAGVAYLIMLANPDPPFHVFAQSAAAVSPPNFATARTVGLKDLLMSFAVPVKCAFLGRIISARSRGRGAPTGLGVH